MLWDSNAPMQLLKTMPKKLNASNLEKIQLVIDADKYKNSLVNGFDLCGIYAPFCENCNKTSIYPCALAYVKMLQAEGMDVTVDAQPVTTAKKKYKNSLENHGFAEAAVEDKTEAKTEVKTEPKIEVKVEKASELINEPVVEEIQEVEVEEPVEAYAEDTASDLSDEVKEIVDSVEFSEAEDNQKVVKDTTEEVVDEEPVQERFEEVEEIPQVEVVEVEDEPEKEFTTGEQLEIETVKDDGVEKRKGTFRIRIATVKKRAKQ